MVQRRMQVSSDGSHADVTADVYAKRIAQGDYYEALEASPEASGRDILAALMTMRRELPELDREWNAIHAALLQNRAAYDATRRMRDETLARLKRDYDQKVRKRVPPETVWQRLWAAQQEGLPLAERQREVLALAATWDRAEGKMSAARAGLTAEFGQGVLTLLDVATNWQKVHAELPDAPPALEAFAAQMAESGRSLATKLPAVDISHQERSQGQAKRLLIRQETCLRCHGTRRVQRTVADDLWKQYESLVPGNPDLAKRLWEIRSGLPSEDISVTIPCPDCTSEVTFEVPADVRRGWVLCGKDSRGERRFARLGQLGLAEPGAASPASSDQPASLRDKIAGAVAMFLYIGVAIALLVLFLGNKIQLPRFLTTPMSGEAQVIYAIVVVGGLLAWYFHSRLRR